jgi:fructokinase
MGGSAFLVVGESLVDLIGEAGGWRFAAAPGGSPLNVAVGLAAAGHRVRLASQVGDDFFGALLRAHLDRHGVTTTDLTTTAEPTSLAFARVDADGVAHYDFRFAWTYAAAPHLDGVDCLHVGSLATVIAPGADAVAGLVTAARNRGVTVSFDPNIRPSLLPDRAAARRRVERLVAAADIVKVSQEDLAWLYPGTADEAAAAGWLARGPRLVVVTRGGAGAIARHGDLVTTCTAPRVAVVDTVGAGDTFTAGLLSALADADADADPGAGVKAPAGWHPDAVAEALRRATAAAAAVCAQRGAAPPPRAAVDTLLTQVRVAQRPATSPREVGQRH